MISIVIITKNESEHIERCLDSVSWADEIIVLDSGSDDDTVEICRRYTSNVFVTDWPGFGPQKQRALDKASGDWVFSIDADEVVTEELKLEILAAIKRTDVHGYEIPRLSSYCGRQMRHGGWWPDYVLRLFQAGSGKFTDSIVHERVIVEGKIERLTSPLEHETYTNLEEVLFKIDSYSTLGAKMLFNQGRKTSVMEALLRGGWAFFRTYILKASLLDGQQGLMLAISNAESTYYKYIKLLMLNSERRD